MDVRVERTKRIRRPTLLLISIGLIILAGVSEGQRPNPYVKKNGRSNVRIKELTSVYDSIDKEHYSEFLIFPVERKCETSDFIQPPEGASSELVSLWSDLLEKFSFANEEMIPDRAVKVLEDVSTKSWAYKMIPGIPIVILLLYVVFALIYIIVIPIIGCALFRLWDLIWVYCFSVGYRKLGRYSILGYYKLKIHHIKKTKPEQLGGYHFRIPKYFRNDNDAEEVFDKQPEAGAKNAGEEVRAAVIKQQLQFNDSSDSEFDIETDYKEIAPPGEDEDTEGLTEEERKLQRKKTRDVFKRAKGRRQSIRLSIVDLDKSESEEEASVAAEPKTSIDAEFADDKNANLNQLDMWSLQLKENSVFPSTIKDKPLDPAEIHRARKTLLQEMREERVAKLSTPQKKDR